MDSSATTADASTSTLAGATGTTAKGNDFMTVGHDMVQVEQNVFFVNPHDCTARDAISNPIVSPKVFDIVRTLLDGIFGQKASETASQESASDCDARQSSETMPTVAEIQDLTSSSTSQAELDTSNATVSPLTQSSSSERYIRSMFDCNEGHPLYEPEPVSQEGVRVGDVGIVTGEGGFDCLFNVCQSADICTNPTELPDDFEMLRSPEILVKPHFQSDTRLYSSEVERTEEPDTKYTCSGSEGGVLELPLGATRFEANNKRSFKELAARHAENWYRYTVLTRGRDASNGSLYIITSCIKCTDWGIAVFYRPSKRQDYLRFTTTGENQTGQPKYRWKGLGAYIQKVAENREADGSNNCVFFRGYKIMLPEDLWENIALTGASCVTMTSDKSHPGNKSKSAPPNGPRNQDDRSQLTDNAPSSVHGTTRAARNASNRLDTSRRVTLYEYSKASPAHPSDLINARLLHQEPKAKVALTHDDDWCDLLQYDPQVLCPEALTKVCLSYTSNVDKYGCASLDRVNLNPCLDTTSVKSSPNAHATLKSRNPLTVDNALLSLNMEVDELASIDSNSEFGQQEDHSKPSKHGSISSHQSPGSAMTFYVASDKKELHLSGKDTRSPFSDSDMIIDDHDIHSALHVEMMAPAHKMPSMMVEGDMDLSTDTGLTCVEPEDNDPLSFGEMLLNPAGQVQITDPHWQSRFISANAVAGPSTISIPTAEDNIRYVGSTQIRHAAGKRRTKEAIYKCPFRNTAAGCDATFTARHNLQYHLNAHLGLRPYKCNNCSFAAASPGTLKRHKATPHTQPIDYSQVEPGPHDPRADPDPDRTLKGQGTDHHDSGLADICINKKVQIL